MASTARPYLGRLLRLAVAGAVVTALTAAAAAAAPPTRTGDAASMGVQADGLSRLGAGDSGSGTGLRSPFPAFLLDRGRYTAFEAPRPGVELYPLGINNRGQISGEYVRVGDDGIPDSESGFVRDQRGRTTVLDVPGAKGTEAVKVNDRGQVVGTFSTDTPIVNNAASFHGYLWDRGKVTRIDTPGAVGTTALGVNNRAQVVGAYWDSTGTAHGYLWERGRFTTIDVRGAVITQPLDINDRGQVVGYYLDDLTSQPGTIHGYLWDRGRLVTIAAHDAPVTLPSDINNRGQIVGQLRTDVTVSPADDPGTRGFLLAKGVEGPFTLINFPGAPRSIANGINHRGQIVGNYQNPNATPSRQRTGAPPPRGMEETTS
jgi:uncharacterized membrane protein